MSQIKTKQLLVNVPNRDVVDLKNNDIKTKITPVNDLYGELSEKVIRPIYTSIDTETLDLTLDNQEMTIKGDVKWAAFTGETADKAYPGNLGARNYAMLTKLSDKFDAHLEEFNNFTSNANYVLVYMRDKVDIFTETIQRDFDKLFKHVDESIDQFAEKITSLHNTDNVLFRTIKKETADRISACEEIHAIIKAEIAHRVEAINKLHEKLDAEIARSIETDKKLENVQLKHTAELEALRIRLDDVKSSLNDKINKEVANLNDKLLKVEELIRRDLVEQVARLDLRIDDEIARATESEKEVLLAAKQYADEVKESILGEGLTEAYDTLVEIEKWLKEQGLDIVNLVTSLSNESATREKADELLRGAINAEVERAQTAETVESLARIKGDTLLQSEIDAEVAARQTLGDDLSVDITKNTNAITAEVKRAKLEESVLLSEINTLKTFINDLDLIDGRTSAQFQDLV